MKREIKFRGKRLDNGEWVYGDYYKRSIIRGYKQRVAHYIGWPVIDKDVIWNEYEEIDPHTVGQYTGIKDARGADIYDGDIIECISSNHIPIRHLIRFCDERGYYAQYDNSNWTGELNECGHICQHYIDKFGKYVIGNIHDNPELLKTEK